MEVALVVGGVGLFALYKWLNTDNTTTTKTPVKTTPPSGIPVVPDTPATTPIVAPPVTSTPAPTPVVTPPLAEVKYNPKGCQPCGASGQFWCPYGIGQYTKGVSVSTYRVPQYDPIDPPIKDADGKGLYFREFTNSCKSTGASVVPEQFVK